jgi:hypothetical protein
MEFAVQRVSAKNSRGICFHFKSTVQCKWNRSFNVNVFIYEILHLSLSLACPILKIHRKHFTPMLCSGSISFAYLRLEGEKMCSSRQWHSAHLVINIYFIYDHGHLLSARRRFFPRVFGNFFSLSLSLLLHLGADFHISKNYCVT